MHVTVRISSISSACAATFIFSNVGQDSLPIINNFLSINYFTINIIYYGSYATPCQC